MCEKHSPTVQVAEGSANVFINGFGAARKGDKLTCGASIASGSDNVFIGGGTYRYLPVDDEVLAWLRYTVDILIPRGADRVRNFVQSLMFISMVRTLLGGSIP